uniref:Uncharacterized protein n=1 Tax=Arundo donax TaxID=35708 RepID=A0A0A9HFM3_ARUDO
MQQEHHANIRRCSLFLRGIKTVKWTGGENNFLSKNKSIE